MRIARVPLPGPDRTASLRRALWPDSPVSEAKAAVAAEPEYSAGFAQTERAIHFHLPLDTAA